MIAVDGFSIFVFLFVERLEPRIRLGGSEAGRVLLIAAPLKLGFYLFQSVHIVSF